jgi:YD repeat-containing protein
MRINAVISHNKDHGLILYEYEYDANGYIQYSKTSTEESGLKITYKRDKFGYLMSSEMNDEIRTEYYYSGKKKVRQMTYEIESGKRISVQTFKEKLNDYGDVIERKTWNGSGLESIEYLEYTYY